MIEVYQRGDAAGAALMSVDQCESNLRSVQKRRRFRRISFWKFSSWLMLLGALFSLYMVAFGFQVLFYGEQDEEVSLSMKSEQNTSGVDVPRGSKHRK